jgi:surface antigen
MTGDQSRLLKPFDRVCWQNDPADQGTVIEKNWSGVTIKWDSRGKHGGSVAPAGPYEDGSAA